MATTKKAPVRTKAKASKKLAKPAKNQKKANFQKHVKKEITRTIRTKRVKSEAVNEKIRLLSLSLIASYILVVLVSFSPTISSMVEPSLTPPAPSLVKTLPVDEDIFTNTNIDKKITLFYNESE